MIVRRVRTGLAIVIAVSIASACTGGEDSAVAPTSSTDDGAIGIDAIQGMMTRHMSALQAGDVGAAMAERCRGSRVPTEDQELFAAQATELIRSEGITGVEVTERSRIRVAPQDQADDAVTFDYVLLFGDERSEPLTGVAIRQDGAVRLCGSVQSRIQGVSEQLAIPRPTGPSGARPLSEWVPSRGPDGATAIDDAAVNERDPELPGWESGWTAAWQFPDYGGARVTIDDFAADEAATEAVSTALGELTADVTEVFDVEGAPFAVGTRYAAVAWTMIQAAETGYQCDRVTMRFGDVVVTIDACGLSPTSSHEQVLDLAAQVVEIARS